MTTYNVAVYGDEPPAVGDDIGGYLTGAHMPDGDYEMTLRSAKALVRRLESMGLFAAVVAIGIDEVVWVSQG